MKRWFENLLVLLVAILVLFPAVLKESDALESANYNSEANMKASISEVQSYLSSQYSSTKSNKYKGTATVKTSSQSDIGLVLTNIDQETMTVKWNNSHTNSYKIEGSCGLVALDIMIQKYMTVPTGKLPNSDTKYGVFSKLVDYAFDSGIFDDNGKASGTTLDEQKKIANYYMKTYQNSKYSANGDEAGLWGTLK